MNRFLLFTSLVLMVVGIAVAYDFDDSEYNRQLSEELEQMYEPDYFSHPRVRRDEEAVTVAADKDKCKKRRFRGCCADDTIEELHEEDKVLKKECFKQVTGRERDARGHSHMFLMDHFKCDKDKTEKHRKEMTCIYQCVGQKRGVVDSEGKVLESEIKRIIKEKFAKFEKEAWLLPKLDAITEKCVKEGVEAQDKFDAKKKDKDAEKDQECNPAGIKIGHCIWREIQLGCPADQIKDEKACSKIRERISNVKTGSELMDDHDFE